MISMNKNEDIVDTNGQDQERNDFNDNKRCRNAKITEKTNTGCHGRQDNQDSTETKYQLDIDLQRQPVHQLHRRHTCESNVFFARESNFIAQELVKQQQKTCMQ